MFQLVAQATATPQAAHAPDPVTNFFLLLAVAAFAVVLLRLVSSGELGSVLTTVGSVLAAVVVIALASLVLFFVLITILSLLDQ